MPITKSKVNFNYDLSDQLEGVPKKTAALVKSLVGELLLAEIEDFTARQSSPVKNFGSFKPLSKEYKKIKRSKGKGSKANLRLDENMIPAIKAVNSPNGVDIKITDSLEKKKAENHNHGITVPPRRFIPNDVAGQDFKPSIKKKVNKLIKGLLSDL